MSQYGYVPVDDDEFLSSTASKCPVIICIDCSKSMYRKNEEGVSRINRLKNGIDRFYEEIRNDENALDSLDLCITGYMEEGFVIREFGFLNPDESSATLNFKMGGISNMGAGIKFSLDLLEARKEQYKKMDISYHQPFLIVMSDGHSFGPDMNLVKMTLEEASKRCIDLENNRRLTVLPVFIGGKLDSDKEAVKELGSLSQVNKVLNIDSSLGFMNFFRYLSSSISISAAGDADDDENWIFPEDDPFFDDYN